MDIGAARYATDKASYPAYDDMLKMHLWPRFLTHRLWTDDAIDETTCEALTGLTESWSGTERNDL